MTALLHPQPSHATGPLSALSPRYPEMKSQNDDLARRRGRAGQDLVGAHRPSRIHITPEDLGHVSPDTAHLALSSMSPPKVWIGFFWRWSTMGLRTEGWTLLSSIGSAFNARRNLGGGSLF